MKPFVTTITAIATLLLAQGCSSFVKSGETSSSTTTKQHENHSMSNEKTLSSAQSNPHAEHSMGDGQDSGSTQAKLTAPTNITPNTPVPLAINILDSSGKAIANFDTFQEKLMHLIVVSDDLQFFSHLHPKYKDNGRFEVEAIFPKSGNYTLFSDYKPSGQSERISVLKTGVSGAKTSASTAVDTNRTKTFGRTKVNLTLDQSAIQANEEVTMMFNLQDAANNKPVTDLQPYLGETGHLVVVKQSTPLTKADYVHAHAVRGTPAGQVHFMTQFPEPGKYKLWGQFNRDGQVVTADFWVNVI